MAAKKTDKSGPASRARMAVCLCDCGQSLDGKLDYAALAGDAGQLPGVARVVRCSKLCQGEGINELLAAMSSQRISRALIAACTPGYYQVCLDKALESAGVSPHLMGKVNIREHCAWVHPDRAEATAKASGLIAAAAARLRRAEAVGSQRVSLNPGVLVIGAGLAGMQTALALAGNTRKVTLVEKAEQVGGAALEQETVVEASGAAAKLAEEVQANRRITVLTNSELKSLTGRFGEFQARLSDRKVECGAVVVATGQKESAGPEQLPSLNGILSFSDLSRSLRANRLSNLQRIGIALDLSVQQDRAATRAALQLARRARQRWFCEVYVFCRHLRVGGQDQEQEYLAARQSGVVVIRSLADLDISQEVTAVRVKGMDEQTGREFDLVLDLLAVANVPVTNNGQGELAGKLLTGKPSAGLVQRDNVFLLPVDSGRKGIFFAGTCRGSMEWKQALADGLTAAGNVQDLLSGSSVKGPAKRAEVDPAKCAFCLTCYRSCPHGAIGMDPENRAAVVIPMMCQACGVCTVECPAKAIELVDFTDEQLSITSGENGSIIVFACENSALPAADRAGLDRMEYSSQVQIVPVPCAGRVDPVHILRALQRGASKVLVLGCHEEACKYLHGNSRARARLDRLKGQLCELGLESDCLQIGSLMAADAERFVGLVSGDLEIVSE